MKLERLPRESITLRNGVSVTALCLPHAHRVVMNAHLASGPAYESPRHNGICHFLEHMLYRGTAPHPSAHAQAEAFESLGGNLGATTYVDHGAVAVSAPPSMFDRLLPLLAEVYQRPVFGGIEIEKGIVREEILEGLDDDDQPVDADDLVRRLCFAPHALARPIIGTIETLAKFDRALVARYHRALYVGANTVIAIAGPLEPERVLRAVEAHFAELPRGRRPESPPLALQRKRRYHFVRHAASQTELRVAFRAPADGDPLEPAVDLLLRLVDDGMSTRLYHRLCDELGLCYEVSAGYESYVSGGIFDIAAQTANERAPRVLDEVFQLITDLRDRGPREDELTKAKARLRWSFDEMLDDPATLTQFTAAAALAGVPDRPAERRDQLLAVTLAGVKHAAERVFDADRMSVIAVGSCDRRRRKALERSVDRFA